MSASARRSGRLWNTVTRTRFSDSWSPGSMRYCSACPKDRARRTGENICSFTTFYWDHLVRHEDALRGNPRLSLQIRSLARLDPDERSAIVCAAEAVRENPAVCHESKHGDG